MTREQARSRIEWDRVLIRLVIPGWDIARDFAPDARPLFSRVIDQLKTRGGTDELILTAIDANALWFSESAGRLIRVVERRAEWWGQLR